ncbi:MAG: ArsC family reductase [Gammaproteobacteria bacterium]|nr:ArsC family reductase [Gammaproteobacteria bacterium]
MLTIYGIKNCDTMKKARAWLAAQGRDYAFHDYKTAGLSEAKLREWISRVGWETLLNTRGTTWRGLPETAREAVDEAKAVALMLANTSLVKRPVLEAGGRLLVGFAEEKYREALS